MMTSEGLFARIPEDAPYRPLLEAMYTRNSWLLKPMLEFLHEPKLGAYLAEVGAVESVLAAVKGGRGPGEVSDAMRGLQFHSMEFLKLQTEFAKTGEYRAKDYDRVYEEVYSSGGVMARYLDGLLLTYIAWPNHYRLLRWYKDAFLAKAPPGRCLEIGPGHGWLALCQLRSDPRNTFVGLDISEHSVRYTRAVLQAGGIEPSRYSVSIADARAGLPEDVGEFDRIVIAEVVEHLADPATMLKSAVAHARPGALFFITTVVNIEAVDHLYLFRTLDEVRELTRACGLEVIDELDMELKMSLKLRDPAYEVALVCRPR